MGESRVENWGLFIKLGLRPSRGLKYEKACVEVFEGLDRVEEILLANSKRP